MHFIPTRYKGEENYCFNRPYQRINISEVILSPEDEDLRSYIIDGKSSDGSFLQLKCQNEYPFLLHSEVADRMGLNQERSPKFCIIHSNGNKMDNRRENIKLISRAELNAELRKRKKALTPQISPSPC